MTDELRGSTPMFERRTEGARNEQLREGNGGAAEKPVTLNQQGMALILVVLVLTALVTIGTPFVISMKLQERGSVFTVDRERAHLASLSARNHTLAHLFNNHPSREREVVDDDGIPAHKYDTWEEFQPTFAPELAFDESRIAEFLVNQEKSEEKKDEPPGYSMRGDASRRTIDATVEDEQGKINLNTAMPNLIGNLLAGSHLSEAIKFDQRLTELPLDDTSAFPADDDSDTVDGVVVILNPILFTVEAISYRGKTETHLTGCFRGEYISGTWEHQKGWPVFDLRGLKVFLHRYYNLSDGKIATYRTPQSIRQIADWSVIPYFLETMAVFGLDLKNMQEFGLTPEMLVRAGLQQYLDKFEKEEVEVDATEYRKTRRDLIELGIPAEAIDLLEQFRGKVAVIQAGKVAKDRNLSKVGANAFKGAFETTIKKEFKRVKDHSKGYFPMAIAAYQEIFDQPGFETFTATDFERLRGDITTYSSIDALWSAEQMILGEISTDAFLGVPSFRLGRYDHFNPGTLVRIRSVKDPRKLEFHLAAGAFPSGIGGGGGRGSIIQGGVILKDRLKFEYEEREAMVSAQLRHPVNINSASARVIAAVLTGLSTDRFTQQFDSVTAGEARALADLILESLPITDFGKFRELIDQASTDGVIDDEDVTAILLNAVNPNHPRLTISTTGFCYASTDVYTIEASGVVRNPSGVETASDRFREVIEVAPPDPLVHVIETQDDWTGIIFRRDAPRNDRWPTSSTQLPGRAQHLMTTGPVPINQKRFEAPALDSGALLALSTESPQINGVTQSIEHFPESIEGLEDASFSLSLGTLLPEDPISIDFWVRPRSVAGDQVLLDSLANQGQPFENRIRLMWKGDTRELVLQIYDDARITNYGGREVLPCAEIVHPMGSDWQPDTWYHVTAGWGSAIPGDQFLMVDQRPVGEHTFLTELAGGISENQEGYMSVKDTRFASRLPKEGSLWVGGEVIDYTEREGTRFRISSRNSLGELASGRARRGTARRAHAAGTTVRPFGYSVELAASDPEIPPQSMDQVIGGTGGAGLESVLRQPMAVQGRLDSFSIPGVSIPFPATYPIVSYTQFGNEPTFLLPFTPGLTQLTVHSTVNPLQLGFPESGYLCVKYWLLPNGSAVWQRAVEFVRYQAFTPGPGADKYTFTGLLRGRLQTDQIDTGLLLGGGRRQVEVFSVSIETNVTNLSQRYPPSGVAQITPPQGEVEWFYYKTIEEGRFFVADPRLGTRVTFAPGFVSRFFRGYVGTERTHQFDDPTALLPASWPAGTAITPVLRTIRAGPAAWDRVLIAESLNQGSPRREPSALRVRKVIDGDNGVMLGFDRAPRGTYLSNALPRVKRFPTGELPTQSSGTFQVGSSALGAAGAFDGTIDEIRLSKLRPPGGWGVMITDAAGAPNFQPATTGGAPGRDLIREYSRGAEVDLGKPLDRLRMVPVPQLQGDGSQISFDWPDPSEFATRREGFLLQMGNEVLYGEKLPSQSAGGGIAYLMLPLRRTPDITLSGPNPRRQTISQVLVHDTARIPDSHGFLSISSEAGVEILYYERTRGTSLINVQRGMFGTIVGDYRPILNALGTSSNVIMRSIQTYEFDLMARSLMDTAAGQGSLETLLPITTFAAARLTGGIEFAVPVSRGNDFPTNDGYLRFDDGNRGTTDEVVAYIRRTGDQLNLGRDDRTGRPIFRQRFGTPRRDPPKDTIVTEFLTRYHDRFEPEAESSDMMKWERSITIPGAHFDRLSWELQDDRSGVGRADVMVYTRLDSVPSWDEKPGDSRDELTLFQKPDADNTIDRTADQLELRIMYRFRQGAYGPAQSGSTWNHEWKRTPIIDQLIIEYRKDWRIIHREDLPF